MPRPATQKELNELALAGCAGPGCAHRHKNELFLHSQCHPRAPTWAKYSGDTGVLTIECSVCRRKIVEILVDEGVEAPPEKVTSG